MIKGCAMALGMFAAIAATPAWAVRDTAQYTSLTVFGDSLVDAGNLYIFTNGGRPSLAEGYNEHRFNDGFDYPDLLSMDLFGHATTPSLLGGNNFAYGGARIVNTGDAIPDLAVQINRYLATGREIDVNGLYIMNFGANDVFGALGVMTGGVPSIGDADDIPSYLQQAANEYAAGVQRLNNLGVRNILLTDFPLGGNPLTNLANTYLNTALSNLTLDADTDLFFYSLSDVNLRILADPSAFGLPPFTDSRTCIQAGAQQTGCTGIFSFDGIHPTAAVQAAGYAEMNERFGLTAVQAVPETSSWAFMIAGLGMIGAAMRYRRRSKTAHA